MVQIRIELLYYELLKTLPLPIMLMEPLSLDWLKMKEAHLEPRSVEEQM